MMMFNATRKGVFNRGVPPIPFLQELVEIGRTLPDELFAPNPNKDIYYYTKPELGPWIDLLYRRAAMLESIRVLAGFESSWNWKEGVDTSRLGPDTPENSEAGAWQVSYDARRITPALQKLLDDKGIKDGVAFQRAMKFDHPLAVTFIVTLLRYTTHHHGPLYKGSERLAIRTSLRGPEQSIYPWLSRASAAEFKALLS